MVIGLPDIGATPAFASASGPPTPAGRHASFRGLQHGALHGAPAGGPQGDPGRHVLVLRRRSAPIRRVRLHQHHTPVCQPFPPFSTTSRRVLLPAVGAIGRAKARRPISFADGVHPTTAAHATDRAVRRIDDHGADRVLAARRNAAAHALSLVHTIYDGLDERRHAPVGSWTAFAADDSGKFDVDPGIGNTGLTSDLKSASVGVTARISEAATLGLAVGQAKNDASFGVNTGSFRTTEKVFLALRRSSTDAASTAPACSRSPTSIYDDVRRNIVLGPITRVRKLQPGRLELVGILRRGLRLRDRQPPHRADRFGHFAERDRERFRRVGRGLVRPAHLGADKSSEVWSVGVHASMQLQRLDAVAAPDRRQGAARRRRYVTASPLSLASGQQLRHPGVLGPTAASRATPLGVRGT